MKMTRFATAAVALVLVAGVAFGKANRTIWMEMVHHPFLSNSSADTSYGRTLAQHFDACIADDPDQKWAKYTTPHNSDFQVWLYGQTTNCNTGNERLRKYSIYNYYTANSLDPEGMWLHLRYNTRLVGTQDGSSVDYKPGEPYNQSYSIISLSTASACVDYSTNAALGWPAGTPTQVSRQRTDTLMIGNPDPFYYLRFTVSTAAPSGWTGKWKYLASDSTWKPLVALDSTLSPMVRDTMAQRRLTQSGGMYFEPPSDWGRKFAFSDARTQCNHDRSVRGYWIALICSTQTGGLVGPELTQIRRGYIGIRSAYPNIVVPGWNPSLDANSNGFIDSTEWAARAAGDTANVARIKWESRYPYNKFWNFDGGGRWLCNVSDTTYRRALATWMLAQCDTFQGFYEDNCVPSDGSFNVSSAGVDLNDTTFCGGLAMQVYDARVASTWGTGYKRGQIVEYSSASDGNYPGGGASADSTKYRPGRLFHLDHLRTDSLMYYYLFRQHRKAYVGNGSQFYSDWFRSNYDASTSTKSITSISGPVYASGVQTNAKDSAAYFGWRYHSGWEHENFNKLKATVFDVQRPVAGVPEQWSTGRYFVLANIKQNVTPYTASYYDSTYSPSQGAGQHYAYNTIQPGSATGLYSERDRMASLAAFLCFQTKDSAAANTSSRHYFGWRPANTTYTNAESSAWWPACNLNIGNPVEDSARVYKRLLGSNESPNDSIIVFFRRYTGGMVFFRPKYSSSSRFVTAGGGSDAWPAFSVDDTIKTTEYVPAAKERRKLNYDGTTWPKQFTMDTLRNEDGRIYIDVPTGADVTPPVVTLISPDGGGTYPVNQPLNIDFTATDNVGVAYCNFTYSIDGGSTWLDFPDQELGYARPTPPGIVSAPLDVGMPGAANKSTIRVRVRCYDALNNVGSASSSTSFTVSQFTGGSARRKHRWHWGGGKGWMLR